MTRCAVVTVVCTVHSVEQ